jgi:photosystem II stability/assembly factor-like uncharacterized protein
MGTLNRFALLAAAVLAPTFLYAQDTNKSPEEPWQNLFGALTPRSVGPTNMSGRIMDIAVFEKDPRIFFVATASGGLWRTENAGTTFSPIFDKENTVSLGSVAVSQTDSNVLWVGTGEHSSRNSVAWGDGVYKTTDGGKTWVNAGLVETRHISKVIIDPKAPNTVYVGALGRLWGPNDERGVYKTTDAGKTWTQVLKGDSTTGVIDLVMNPKNPKELIAALWTRERKAYDFTSGGPGSAVMKTTDGGKTWRKLTKGLPPGPLGRIGLAYHGNNPKVIWATVEYREPAAPPATPPVAGAAAGAVATPAGATSAAGGTGAGATGAGGAPRQRPSGVTTNNAPSQIRFNGGGVFKSVDGGESWAKVNNLNPRPFYFSTIRQDPKDDKRVYVLGVSLHVSDDGGTVFRTANINVHADLHAMWINPNDSNHLIVGCDGGVYVSHDRGLKWTHFENMPLGQFYGVAFDFRKPYWVYGGLQDNGSWGQPTQSTRAGVSWFDVTNVGGGDGFHVQVDPNDWSTVYSESQGGAVGRNDMKTGLNRSIRPRIQGETLRFNWSTPIHLSPHNSRIIYVGANRLFKSLNRGDTWSPISPDLTTNDPSNQKAGQKSVTPEDTGAERHCTIITISESPMKDGLIYVGTDDGLVQMTRNGGVTWENVTANIPGLPANTWCSRVIASKWVEGRVYATFDGHRSNDFKPYVYVSEDYGKTWSSLSSTLPDYDCVYVIREGEKNADLLYLGSEMSLRISLDRGKTWGKFRNIPAPAPVTPEGGRPVVKPAYFPTVAVHDVVVHPRELDLVIGTHGRSIWTLNVSALEQLDSVALAKDVVLCQPTNVLNLGRIGGAPWDGDAVYTAPNTQPGTTVYYYLKVAASGEALVTISDVTGERKVELRGGIKAGLNGVPWNGRLGNRLAPVGDYRVTLKVGGKEYVTSVKVENADGVGE